MKFIRILVLFLVVMVAALFLMAFRFVGSVSPQYAGVQPLDPVVGAISLFVGGFVSLLFSVWPGLRTAFDQIAYNWKPVVMFGVFLALAAVAGALKCGGVYDAGVSCPTQVTGWVNLLVYAAIAWSGSQWAHANGGAQLAQKLKEKDETA